MIAIPSELAVSPVLLCYEMDAFPENPDWPELKKWYVAPHARQLDCARGQAKTIAVKLAICGRNSSSQLGAKTGRPPQDISALPSSIAAIDAQKPSRSASRPVQRLRQLCWDDRCVPLSVEHRFS
jgi:hypothetical protein